MFNKKKKNSGSSLIEVLVAIVVVGLVVTGAMLSISYSIKNSSEARYREVASQLAQDGMEVVKLRREVDQWSVFYGVANNSTPRFLCEGTRVLTNTTSCTVNVSNKNYTRYVELSRVAATASTPAIVTATVTVEWRSDSNALMDVAVTQEFRERIL